MDRKTRKQVCRHCHHTEDVHNVAGTGECGCGCVRLEPVDREKREASKRTFLVTVKMFVKNRWIESAEMRIRSGGAAHASELGIRQARRECLKPRTRIDQVCVRVIPVRK